ncbi:GNAT family N-acetyltransferase [Microbacterium soli]|uniref:GNAT family N-acetyltransferase n=1 Tax=Microbacterium soli TaxID=446075 RepID=A0ABP7MSD7_9MICO
MESVVLRTERLVLSIPTGADVDAITAACQDAAVQRYTTVPKPYARADATDFVRLVSEWWGEGSSTTWAIRHDDRFAGAVGLADIDDGVADLGYWLAPDARGRGIASEAVRGVVAWGFDGPLTLHRISWRAVVGNLGSAHTARAAGFRYEGRMREAFRHGAHRDDAWIAGLLATDDRTPVDWPVL